MVAVVQVVLLLSAEIVLVEMVVEVLVDGSSSRYSLQVVDAQGHINKNGSGGSGVVNLRYPNATNGAGLTGSTGGSDKMVITAGTGTV